MVLPNLVAVTVGSFPGGDEVIQRGYQDKRVITVHLCSTLSFVVLLKLARSLSQHMIMMERQIAQ